MHHHNSTRVDFIIIIILFEWKIITGTGPSTHRFYIQSEVETVLHQILITDN